MIGKDEENKSKAYKFISVNELKKTQSLENVKKMVNEYKVIVISSDRKYAFELRSFGDV